MSEKEEQDKAANEAKMAAELATANIQRFIQLQAERESALIMRAHEQKLSEAAHAAGTAAELAAINIRRFIELQSAREGSLIMRAHQQQVEGKQDRKA